MTCRKVSMVSRIVYNNRGTSHMVSPLVAGVERSEMNMYSTSPDPSLVSEGEEHQIHLQCPQGIYNSFSFHASLFLSFLLFCSPSLSIFWMLANVMLRKCACARETLHQYKADFKAGDEGVCALCMTPYASSEIHTYTF